MKKKQKRFGEKELRSLGFQCSDDWTLLIIGPPGRGRKILREQIKK